MWPFLGWWTTTPCCLWRGIPPLKTSRQPTGDCQQMTRLQAQHLQETCPQVAPGQEFRVPRGGHQEVQGNIRGIWGDSLSRTSCCHLSRCWVTRPRGGCTTSMARGGWRQRARRRRRRRRTPLTYSESSMVSLVNNECMVWSKTYMK